MGMFRLPGMVIVRPLMAKNFAVSGYLGRIPVLGSLYYRKKSADMEMVCLI
jgi:hypothetical protein